ncbi:MAG: hypothetical protein K9K64_01970 [Desulfohalobiaceae bacterium]|nr:hypothetical protein [Desulfohalobiaceae bacterium]
MPELPDVEVYRRRFEQTSLGYEIQAVEIGEERIIKGIAADDFRSRLIGREFAGVSRHGKYCFAKVDQQTGWLMMHFGMTGYLTHIRSQQEKPKDWVVCFTFDSGSALVYASTRKLGHLSHVSDPGDFIADQKLGPDPMDRSFSRETFLGLVTGRKGRLKTALMDQSLLASIGNVYSDEILFQAGFHPGVKISDLGREQLIAIYEVMGRVLESAIEHGADPDRLPADFLIPHRSENDHCPVCGGPVKRVSLSGRSAYFCPSCQPGA